MIIRQITKISEDVQIVRELYEQSFPEAERLPFKALLNLLSVAEIDFCSYYLDNHFIGFTYTFTVGKLCWFFYFAVVPEKRGEGIGTEILRSVLERHKQSLVVIDVEHVEQPSEQDGTAPAGLATPEMRRRRYDFYCRNGFRDSGVRRSFGGVTYQILVCGEGTILDKEYSNLIRIMWKKVKEAGGD